MPYELHVSPVPSVNLSRTKKIRSSCTFSVFVRLEESKQDLRPGIGGRDRNSTRLNSSHSQISYAVFCLIKKRHSSYPVSADSDRWHGPKSIHESTGRAVFDIIHQQQSHLDHNRLVTRLQTACPPQHGII